MTLSMKQLYSCKRIYSRSTSTRLRRLIIVVASTMVFCAAALQPLPAHAGTQTEIDGLIKQGRALAKKIKDSTSEKEQAKLAAKLAAVVMETGTWVAIKKVRDLNPFSLDTTNFSLPVNLTLKAPVIGTNAELASLFGLSSIDPTIEVALNDAAVTDSQLAHGLASFLLADTRLLGALDAGDLISAEARRTEMIGFRDDVLSIIPDATANTLATRDALVGLGLDITFDLVDDIAQRDEFAVLGRDAFHPDVLADLIDLGMLDDQIDNDLVPSLATIPASDNSFVAIHETELIVLPELVHALDEILSAHVVPEPATLSLLGVGGLILVKRLRR